MAKNVSEFKVARQRAQKNIELDMAREAITILHLYMSAESAAVRQLMLRALDRELKEALESGAETPAGLVDKLQMAIAKDAWRPKNMSIYRFALSPDLGGVGGEFSTFMPMREIARNGRALLPMLNLDSVAEQYAVDVVDCLDNMSQDVVDAAIAGNIHAMVAVLQKIADDMGRARNAPVSVFVRLKPGPSKTYGAFRVFKDKDTGQRTYRIDVYYDQIANNLAQMDDVAASSQNIKNQILFVETLVTFLHEFGHYIDAVVPNRGALGPQVVNMADSIYDAENLDAYVDNPEERSSRTIETRTHLRVMDWLSDKNRE